MRDEHDRSLFRGNSLWSLPLFCALLLGPFTTTHAANVSVICDGSGLPDAYATVQDAINHLQTIPKEPHTISVQGSCPDFVSIDDLDNITITKGPGDATLGGFGINNSRHIRFKSLQFDECMWVGGLSVVAVLNSHLEVGNSGCALWASEGSQVRILDSTIEGDGTGYGVGVDGAARLSISGATYIRNVGVGVSADSGGILTISGPVTIERARECGVYLYQGATGIIGGPGLGGSVTIQNSGGGWCGGVWVERNASVSLWGVTVKDNDPWGIMLIFNATAAIRDTTITGNRVYGVRLVNLSSALFHLPNDLSNNGKTDLSCTPDSHAGVNNPTNLPIGIKKMVCPGFAELLEEQPGSMPPVRPAR